MNFDQVVKAFKDLAEASKALEENPLVQNARRAREANAIVRKEVGEVAFDNMRVEPSAALFGGAKFTIGDISYQHISYQHINAEQLDDLITMLSYIKQRTEELNNGN